MVVQRKANDRIDIGPYSFRFSGLSRAQFPRKPAHPWRMAPRGPYFRKRVGAAKIRILDGVDLRKAMADGSSRLAVG